MSEQYFFSLLVVGGVSLGFAMHATSLAMQTRRGRYVYLMILALLEAAYCFLAWRYFSLTDSSRACVFGELTMDLRASIGTGSCSRPSAWRTCRGSPLRSCVSG